MQIQWAEREEKKKTLINVGEVGWKECFLGERCLNFSFFFFFLENLERCLISPKSSDKVHDSKMFFFFS